jgi:hypothetical protein
MQSRVPQLQQATREKPLPKPPPREMEKQPQIRVRLASTVELLPMIAYGAYTALSRALSPHSLRILSAAELDQAR